MTTTTHEQFLRSRPARSALDRLAVEIGGRGTTVARVTRLKGGIVAATHRIELVSGAGHVRSVVLRRFDERWQFWDPVKVTREWDALVEAQGVAVAVPEPLLLDGAGVRFGAPAIVLSCLAGRAVVGSGDAAWARQLAEAMAAIHDRPSALPPESWVLDWQADEPVPHFGGDPMAEALWSVIVPFRRQLAGQPRCLAHFDLHPGNTLWSRRRLTGVVDWGSAGAGWAGYDVAYCALDASLHLGPEAGDRVFTAYEDVTGASIPNRPAWEAVVGLRPIGGIEHWVASWHDLRVPVTVAQAKRRHRQWVDRAIAAAN